MYSSPEADGGKPKEWAMVELQGSLETRHPVPLSGKFIGDLHFTHKVRLQQVVNPFAHLYGKQLFTWLSLVVSLMASFYAILFPTRCLG